ncbi:MAG TPA: DUF507 family protein [bacterium]|nr:DUF507 family protein [bacterium]
MKLKREEIRKIAELVMKNLTAHALIEPKVPHEKLVEKVESLIFKNLEEEVSIEEEVKKLMEQYRAQIASGSIDPQKAYTMIKKQVAKDRKFIL